MLVLDAIPFPVCKLDVSDPAGVDESAGKTLSNLKLNQLQPLDNAECVC